MIKKGQAAMEFLMTYGWAILVVIAAIAALAYFGVLSPGSMLPERTTFQAPLPSIDNAVVTGGTDSSIEIPFRNNKGETIWITDVNNVTEYPGCDIDGMRYANGDPIDHDDDIKNGDLFIIEWDCGAAISSGDRVNTGVVINYNTTSTGLVRQHSGQVQGTAI